MTGTLPKTYPTEVGKNHEHAVSSDIAPFEENAALTLPHDAVITRIVALGEARNAAFERLLKLHSEMQTTLSPIIGSAAARELRDAIWDATCAYRDAWMECI